MLRAGYIERAIAKLAEAIARAAGLRSAGQADAALAELQAAKAELPVVPGVLELLSPHDLRQTLGSDEGMMQLVGVLREEARVYMTLGRERAQLRAERLLAELRT